MSRERCASRGSLLMPVLHVVVPFYNEPDTLEPCLRRVLAVKLPPLWIMRLTIVDDHSEPEARADAERAVHRLTQDGAPIQLLRHDANRGKGAALRTGFDAVLERAHEDDLLIIQDGDLEYDPSDYPTLMHPILQGRTTAVIGTRWGPHRPIKGLKRRIHACGNRMLSRLSNLMTGYQLHDMECCYKLFTIDLLRRMRPLLTEDRFGVEPQIVAALARLGQRVVEVPISYEPRGFSAGKKIGWIDGVRALYVISRERLRRARSSPSHAQRETGEEVPSASQPERTR